MISMEGFVICDIGRELRYRNRREGIIAIDSGRGKRSYHNQWEVDCNVISQSVGRRSYRNRKLEGGGE